MKTNILVIINFIICVIVSVSALSISVGFGLICIAALVFSLLSLSLLNADHYKTGFKMYCICMIVFIPVGLIGIAGVKKLHDQLAEKEFELKRKNIKACK